MWLTAEIAAPKNETPNQNQLRQFMAALRKGNVVMAPEREMVCQFLDSVISLRPNF